MGSNENLMVQLSRIGGDLAVDFVNTVPVLAAGPLDLLTAPEDLIAWLRVRGLLSADEAGRLAGRPDPAAHAEALALREDLRTLFQAHVDGVAPDAARLDRLNSVLRRGALVGAGGHDQLAVEGVAYRVEPQPAAPAWDLLTFPIAQAAAVLLAGDRLRYLRRCENTACVLFFVDLSKNHARRWCSMAVCGNRHKVAAHLSRKRHQG